jgi:hypothetical protein
MREAEEQEPDVPRDIRFLRQEWGRYWPTGSETLPISSSAPADMFVTSRAPETFISLHAAMLRISVDAFAFDVRGMEHGRVIPRRPHGSAGIGQAADFVPRARGYGLR